MRGRRAVVVPACLGQLRIVTPLTPRKQSAKSFTVRQHSSLKEKAGEVMKQALPTLVSQGRRGRLGEYPQHARQLTRV